jgi:hypothetical protein
MASYQYLINTYFPNKKVYPEGLLAEIQKSSIIVACDGVSTDITSDICTIVFKSEISVSEKIILDNVIFAHDGIQTDFNQIIPPPITPLTVENFSTILTTTIPEASTGHKALDVYIHGKLNDTNHNDLPGIQGGAIDDNFHLTKPEHYELTQGEVTRIHRHDHRDLESTHNLDSDINHDLISNVGVNTHGKIDSHLASTLNPHATTKGQVGLGNVDNLQQLPMSYLDTDINLTANSDSKVASQRAVRTFVTNYVAGIDFMVFKGVINCSANPNYPAGNAGETYRISVAGKIGGISGINVETGDMILCIQDNTVSGDQATVGMYWNVVQTNIDGTVVGPVSSVDNRIVSFNGITGKIIKDSGIDSTSVSTAVTNSHTHTNKSNLDSIDQSLATTSSPTFANITDSGLTASQIVQTNASKQLVSISPATAYNQAFEALTSNIKMNNTVSVGSLSTIARADHIHPIDTSREPANSNIQTHISRTDNPHVITATQVGLGNVTNESKVTMFNNPAFTGTPTGITATHVGLGNVPNINATNPANITQTSSYRFTTDAEKATWNAKQPAGSYEVTTNKVTAFQTIPDNTHYPSEKLVKDNLDLKLNTSLKGTANGLAELDSTGKVPATQLPSFVDDVLEYANLASFPVTGETGKIYVAIDTNLVYRWSGTVYISISSSLTLGETSTTAYRGDRGKIAYDHSQIITGNPHGTSKSDIGLSNVTNDAQIKKLSSSIIGDIPTFGTITGDTLVDSYGVETTLVGANTKLPRADAVKTYIDTQITANAFTNEKAQDAVGSILIDTNSIDFTYDDVNNTIKADVKKQNGTTVDLSIDTLGLKAELNSILKTSYDNAVTHISRTDNPHSVTKSQIGLGSVDNIQQMPLSYLDTDDTLAASSDLRVASQNATKTYVDTKVSGISGSISRARAYCSSAGVGQTIANNTWTKLLFDTENFDGNNEFTSSRFTAKQIGYYQVNAVFVLASSTLAGNQEIAIYKTGVRYSSQAGRKTASAVSSVLISDLVYLAVNDYVEIYCFQNSGASKITNVAAGYSSYFSIQKVS